MNVLKWEFSKRFDEYSHQLKHIKPESIEYYPIDTHPNNQIHINNSASQCSEGTLKIYLNTNLSATFAEEEACHEIEYHEFIYSGFIYIIRPNIENRNSHDCQYFCRCLNQFLLDILIHNKLSYIGYDGESCKKNTFIATKKALENITFKPNINLFQLLGNAIGVCKLNLLLGKEQWEILSQIYQQKDPIAYMIGMNIKQIVLNNKINTPQEYLFLIKKINQYIKLEEQLVIENIITGEIISTPPKIIPMYKHIDEMGREVGQVDNNTSNKSNDYREVGTEIKPNDITHVMVRFTLPYGLYLYNNWMTIVINHRPAYFTYKLIPADTIRGTSDLFKVPPIISRVKNDRWGRKELTELSISLPRDSWPENFDLEKKSEQTIMNYCMIYINKFIKGYKFITSEFLLDELSLIDIISFEYIKLDRKNKTYNRSYNLFPFNNSLYSGEKLSLYGEDVYNRLSILMEQENGISIINELRMNANALFMKGNFGMAVLLASLSVESYCKKLIRLGYLKKCMKTDEEIKKLFDNCSFKNLLQSHIKQVCDYDFGDNDLFNQWDKVVRPMRNNIAHGEVYGITEQNAKDIFKIIRSIYDDLNKNIIF